MSIPFYILIKPIVYLVAVIVFWQTAKKNLDSRRRFAAIIAGLFVISVGLSIFEGAGPVDNVISIGGHQVRYAVARGVLENLGLFAIVASLLMLLRKRLETARREVRQLARIAAGSADAIVGIDEEARVTSWNRGAEMVFGYFGDEMIGQKVARLMPRDAWEKCDAAIGRCREEGFVRGLSCRMTGKNAGE
ncbi:MAG: PAS domain S-box protein, partial [Planctomycetes bacterium]|nr:PAS domain S-box protein [Planctomycetota bacterium]